MRRVAGLIAAALVVVGTACGDEGSVRDWDEASDIGEPILLTADSTAASDGFELVAGSSRRGDGSETNTCVKLVVGDMGIGCLGPDGTDGAASGYGATVRNDETRIIWRGATESGSFFEVDHFVVWSSSSPGGRRLEPVVEFDTTHLIWVMKPGEAPWGVQWINAEGGLLHSQSFVGLPDS